MEAAEGTVPKRTWFWAEQAAKRRAARTARGQPAPLRRSVSISVRKTGGGKRGVPANEHARNRREFLWSMEKCLEENEKKR